MNLKCEFKVASRHVPVSPRFRIYFNDELMTERELAFDFKEREYDNIVMHLEVEPDIHELRLDLLNEGELCILALHCNNVSVYKNHKGTPLLNKSWTYTINTTNI